MPITSAEDKAQRRLEVNVRSTLMMGISNEHQLKFNFIKDAKLLLKAIEKIFGLVGALECEKLSQEDVNQKLLRSLSPECMNQKSKGCLAQVQVHRTWLLYPLQITTLAALMKQLMLLMEWVTTARTQVNAANSINIDNLSDVVIFLFFASQPNRAPRKSRQRAGKAQEGVCMWKHQIPYSCVSCVGLVDILDVIWLRRALIMATHGLSTSSLNFEKGLGYEKYNAVPPPYTGNFMPPTPDLSFTGLDEFVNEPVVENIKAMSSEEEPKGNPQMDLQDQGVIDSGCSRHMTGKRLSYS
ncbi:hypothetical protein Tco_0789335 [Tanacetum coccineum]